MVVGDFAQGTQVAVIGGGTGGYPAAIRAAQLGLEVTLIEKDILGGVCLNWGCIPSKALIHVGDLKAEIESADKLGLKTGAPEVDIKKVVEWKDGVVERLRNGVQTLLAKNKVEVVRGTAKLTGENSFEVDGPDGHARYEFQHCILATGSSAAELPGMPRDGQLVIDSTDAVGPSELPRRLVVIGAGAVGLELGMVYAKLGSEVTILEGMDELLPMLDEDIAPVMNRSLRRRKIKLVLGAKVHGMEKTDDGFAELTYETKDGEQKITTDQILVAIGRRPNTAGIGLEKAGVEVDVKGFAKINERLETTAPNIYAVGDMVAGPMLAHRASYQGKMAAEIIAGQPLAYEGVHVPSVFYTDPEIATVGLTSKEAKEQGLEPQEGTFPFKALGRAATLGDAGQGFSKVVTDSNGIVIGVHIVGPSASDLISEGALAVASASHMDDLTLTIHPHPTLPESIEEAAEQVEHKAIHIFSPK